jgi:hypothetical protein
VIGRWPIDEAWRDDRAPAMLEILRSLSGVRHVGVATGLRIRLALGATPRDARVDPATVLRAE